ncbi:transmembrane protein 107 isoform X3 [Struthio camelus]|uniref:transmembrane protein 107 isoform X3 n=1 Tax=Struthio camelus TaxID=8801 RepID=UPI003603DD45
MTSLGALVPARFLALTAHLVAVLTIFWARLPDAWAHRTPTSSRRCPWSSRRRNTPAWTRTALAHAGATVALVFFLFERWDCGAYWGVLGAGSALPAATELLLMVTILGCKRKPL